MQDHMIRVEQIGADVAQGAIGQLDSVPDFPGAVLDPGGDGEFRAGRFDPHDPGSMDAGLRADIDLLDGGIAPAFRRHGLDHRFSLADHHAGFRNHRGIKLPPGIVYTDRIRYGIILRIGRGRQDDRGYYQNRQDKTQPEQERFHVHRLQFFLFHDVQAHPLF